MWLGFGSPRWPVLFPSAKGVTQSFPEEDMAEPEQRKLPTAQAVKEEGHSRNRKLQEQSCGVGKWGSHLIGWRGESGSPDWLEGG